ncbi:MAG: thiamine-phosphate pyrophosphorylase [Actinomycetota bacterium]|nr:thiamine-phosphate pyrophosphorylase [Actinomycetota bacterium]
MRGIDNAKLYLVARAEVGRWKLADLVPDLAAAGVEVIQLREKDMEVGDLLRVTPPVLEACRSAGIPFILNDRPDVALALGADGVHVGQNDLPPKATRRVVGDKAILGLSTHRESEVTAAEGEPIDYFAVGPVYETPTKLGRPAAGIDLVRFAASRARLPWFAIGGIDASNLPEVLGAGATRIVVVRAITEADDPAAAAGRLRRLLDES